jgi:hypothetical protein
MLSELEALCDATLVRSLRDNNPRLVAAVDAFLAAGGGKAELLATVLRSCGGRRDNLTYLAVEAYLGCTQEGTVTP